MSDSVVIIGSGFAAFQLVKMLRKQSDSLEITVITADSGDEYSKPDMSHVFTRRQTAADLVKMSADDFARAFNIRLITNTQVQKIVPDENCLIANGQTIPYGKLVIATGASPFIPAIAGTAADKVITLNSLEQYQSHQQELNSARTVVVIGAGLVGTEVAMDLASSGRQVILTDRARQIMPGLLPEYLSASFFVLCRRITVAWNWAPLSKTWSAQGSVLRSRWLMAITIMSTRLSLLPGLNPIRDWPAVPA